MSWVLITGEVIPNFINNLKNPSSQPSPRGEKEKKPSPYEGEGWVRFPLLLIYFWKLV